MVMMHALDELHRPSRPSRDERSIGDDPFTAYCEWTESGLRDCSIDRWTLDRTGGRRALLCPVRTIHPVVCYLHATRDARTRFRSSSRWPLGSTASSPGPGGRATATQARPWSRLICVEARMGPRTTGPAAHRSEYGVPKGKPSFARLISNRLATRAIRSE